MCCTICDEILLYTGPSIVSTYDRLVEETDIYTPEIAANTKQGLRVPCTILSAFYILIHLIAQQPHKVGYIIILFY